MNYFVSVVRSDASPGPLYGPFEYAEAEQVLRAALIAGNNENGPVEIDAEVEEAIADNGFWTFEGGGGIFIVQSEAYSDEEDEEDDFDNDGFKVEDECLYHRLNPDESLGEFQDGRFVPSRFLLELPADCHRLADAAATNYIGE